MGKKKIGRNDPCICGSGKKYKNCCGNSRIKQNPNHELDRLHQQLQTFALERYGNKIKEQSQRFKQTRLEENSELKDIYFTGMTLWIITKLKFLENNQSILERFYQLVSPKLNPIVKKYFYRWTKANPSIYEVMSVPKDSQGMIELRDLLTNKFYSIPSRADDEYIKGSQIVGTLVPYAGFYSFLLTVIKLYGHNNQTLLEMVDRFSKKKGGFSGHFPDVLTETLLLGIHNAKTRNPLYEHVAQSFADHMAKKGVDDAVILQGLNLWNKFCEQKNPTFKKAGPYAAALDYYVQKHVLGDSEVTQRTIAKEYDTSLSSISTNYRKLSNMVEAGNK